MQEAPAMRARSFGLAAFLASGLILSACAGLPKDFSLGEQSAEAAELEFTAPLDAIGPDAWTIGGIPIGVTDETELGGAPAVGDLVHVHAIVVDGDHLVAREIGPLDPSEPVPGAGDDATGSEDVGGPSSPSENTIEFVGEILSIGDPSWTIGTHEVTVSGETEIKGDLAVGDLVKVHALVSAGLSLQATEIEPVASQNDPGESSQDDSLDGATLHFTGIVEGMQSDRWTVAGLVFRIAPETEIKDGIALGDTVEIEAIRGTDGTLTALEIQLHGETIESRDGADDDPETEGGSDHETEQEDHHESESGDDHGGSDGGDG
jgi:hypothetical protein